MTSPVWDPTKYRKFSAERSRPARDLLGAIALPERGSFHDLGCGHGEIARLVAERAPQLVVVGIDASEEMIAEARSVPSRVTWRLGDVRTWSAPQPVDVIYSNAALHWVPDHGPLLLRLLRSLAPGGTLAVQMPLSWAEPGRRLMRETLAALGLGSPELRQRLEQKNVQSPERYRELLESDSRDLRIWTTTYLHELEGQDPVLEWLEGAALRPVLEDLTDTESERFLADYSRRLRNAYPSDARGVTILPYPRLFIVATV